MGQGSLAGWHLYICIFAICQISTVHFSWLSQDEVLSKAIFWKLHALFVILIPYIKCYHSSCYAVFHTQQKFDPLRFSTENSKEMDPFAFLSFSAGPR